MATIRKYESFEWSEGTELESDILSMVDDLRDEMDIEISMENVWFYDGCIHTYSKKISDSTKKKSRKVILLSLALTKTKTLMGLNALYHDTYFIANDQNLKVDQSINGFISRINALSKDVMVSQAYLASSGSSEMYQTRKIAIVLPKS